MREKKALAYAPTILVAERDKTLRKNITEALRHHGFAVVESHDKTGTRENLQNHAVELVIMGSLENGSWDGLDVAREFRQSHGDFPVILITTQNSEDLAVAALKTGVVDYFRPPYSPDELVSGVERYFSASLPQQLQPDAKLENSSSDIVDAHRMIGESLVMSETRAAIGKIAATDSNVLVTGETGTGKDLAAELIHKNSPRAREPFVCINCAAIPDSLLESELFGYERGSFTGAYSSSKGKLKFGDGGTIFLDEIGDLSPYAQAKILRLIESREVQRLGGRRTTSLNVRFIAATNKNLEQSVSDKTFRQDLYFRLNVRRIRIPRLKDRKEDIPLLRDYYIRHFNRQFGRRVERATEDVAESMLRYDWPGNIRELKNLLEAAVGNARGRQISVADLPEGFRQRILASAPLPADERYPLLVALDSTNWNISKAARKLNWSRMTLYRKMAKYNIRRVGKKNDDTGLFQADGKA